MRPWGRPMACPPRADGQAYDLPYGRMGRGVLRNHMSTPQMKIDGIVPIVPTPFNVEGEIEWGELLQLLDFAASVDVCAVCLPAYASEFYKLSVAERQEIVGVAAGHLKGRLPVIGQANSASAAEAAELARCAQNAGASAVAVAVPRQFAVREEDLLRFFDVILSAIDVPLLLQDFNPGGPTVSPQFI